MNKGIEEGYSVLRDGGEIESQQVNKARNIYAFEYLFCFLGDRIS